MALSLYGERSVTAATPNTPVRAVFAWLEKVTADRARRTALKSLLELDASRLNDLGLSHADIQEAMMARGSRSSTMVLNTARARRSLR